MVYADLFIILTFRMSFAKNHIMEKAKSKVMQYKFLLFTDTNSVICKMIVGVKASLA